MKKMAKEKHAVYRLVLVFFALLLAAGVALLIAGVAWGPGQVFLPGGSSI